MARETGPIRPDTLLTSRQAAEFLQVDRVSVKNWAEAGRFEFFKTPGNHIRIQAKDLAAFISEIGMPMPKELAHSAMTRVLIVDDSGATKKQLAKNADPNVQVDVESSGTLALTRLHRLMPRLLVLNAFLQDVDAIAVCRKLSEDPETKGMRIAILADEVTEALEQEAFDAGAAACVKKPLNIKNLLQ